MLRLTVLTGLLLTAACSAAPDDHTFQGTGGQGAGASSSGSGTSTTSGDVFDAGTTTSSGSGGGCSDAAKLVYLIGSDNALYSFDPPSLTTQLKGVISCPGAGGATPFSMAVDRQGVAWVLFSDGRIFHVDVQTVACTPTSFVPGQESFYTFGMGFVSDAPNSVEETLYVGDYLGKGLGKIDPVSLALTFVGPYSQLGGQAAEITGTGDAHLFGFYAGNPVIVAEIDKSNAQILSQAQPDVTIGSGWAFAFWGGDFWLFTSPSGTSQIDQYRPANGTTSTVVQDIGSNIVGAGVSTCAPVTPPE
jgi:hypothetical protein